MQLSLERQLYQMIIGRLDGDKVSSEDYQRDIRKLVNKGIGGFILFGGKKDTICPFIHDLQAESEIPLFIASDIERGVGQQIHGATTFPSQMAVAAAINKELPDTVILFEQMLGIVAAEARACGINMALTPVLDVNYDPENPIICTRSFSDDPDEVSWFGKKYIETLQGNHLLCCAKHFPGHGDTSTDSHISLPVITKSLDDLMTHDIRPFCEAIAAGVGAVMVGHLSIPALDTLPASVSKNVMFSILRKELGFEGLILTDALNMHALRDIKAIATACVRAGTDILLHPADAEVTVKELLASVATGVIDEGTIDTAVNRILHAKEMLAPTNTNYSDFQEHTRSSNRLFERSITLVKETAGILPLRDDEQAIVFFIGDSRFFEASPLRQYIADSIVIQQPTAAGVEADKADLLTKKVLSSKTVFAVFTSIAAWRGSSGISPQEQDIINDLCKQCKASIIISFGSPYVLNHFREADVLIAAYDTSVQAQEAVIQCLGGKIPFTGKTPVKLAPVLI